MGGGTGPRGWRTSGENGREHGLPSKEQKESCPSLPSQQGVIKPHWGGSLEEISVDEDSPTVKMLRAQHTARAQ